MLFYDNKPIYETKATTRQIVLVASQNVLATPGLLFSPTPLTYTPAFGEAASQNLTKYTPDELALKIAGRPVFLAPGRNGRVAVIVGEPYPGLYSGGAGLTPPASGPRIARWLEQLAGAYPGVPYQVAHTGVVFEKGIYRTGRYTAQGVLTDTNKWFSDDLSTFEGLRNVVDTIYGDVEFEIAANPAWQALVSRVSESTGAQPLDEVDGTTRRIRVVGTETVPESLAGDIDALWASSVCGQGFTHLAIEVPGDDGSSWAHSVYPTRGRFAPGVGTVQIANAVNGITWSKYGATDEAAQNMRSNDHCYIHPALLGGFVNGYQEITAGYQNEGIPGLPAPFQLNGLGAFPGGQQLAYIPEELPTTTQDQYVHLAQTPLGDWPLAKAELDTVCDAMGVPRVTHALLSYPLPLMTTCVGFIYGLPHEPTMMMFEVDRKAQSCPAAPAYEAWGVSLTSVGVTGRVFKDLLISQGPENAAAAIAKAEEDIPDYMPMRATWHGAAFTSLMPADELRLGKDLKRGGETWEAIKVIQVDDTELPFDKMLEKAKAVLGKGKFRTVVTLAELSPENDVSRAVRVTLADGVYTFNRRSSSKAEFVEVITAEDALVAIQRGARLILVGCTRDQLAQEVYAFPTWAHLEAVAEPEDGALIDGAIGWNLDPTALSDNGLFISGDADEHTRALAFMAGNDMTQTAGLILGGCHGVTRMVRFRASSGADMAWESVT